jgi:FeS assembly protein IscX
MLNIATTQTTMRDDTPFNELYWDSTYAIAVTLLETYPDIQPSQVGLLEIADMVVALPDFCDDPAFVTERILQDIQTVWYEEKV